jgi:hypothetical protein
LPCVTCSSVGERGAWAQTDGTTTPGGAAQHHAIGARPTMGRWIARMDVDFVRARGVRVAGIVPAMAETMRLGQAHATVAAPRAEMMGTMPGAAMAVVGTATVAAQRDQADQCEVAHALPARTMQTTIARAGAACPPTARRARVLPLAPTPGMLRSSVDGVQQPRVGCGRTRIDRAAHAPAVAIPVGVCPDATIHAIRGRGAWDRQRQPRNLAASRSARRSVLSC